jgi:predicted glutamine amidotransferase
MMVVSEPLDAEEGSWTAVENSHILMARPGQNPVVASFNPN